MGIPGSPNPLLMRRAAAAAGDDDAYQIEKSLRFNDDDTAYLNRTPSALGNRRTWTWSGWVKRSSLGSLQMLFTSHVSGNDYVQLFFNSDDTLRLDNNNSWKLFSNAVYRDFSAWMHIVCAVDTTLATADDRIKLFVNGKQLTSFGTRANPSQNAEGAINKTLQHSIGSEKPAYTRCFDGYLADVYFTDGLALSPAAFGSFDSTGVWNPKAFAIPTPNDGTTWSSKVYTSDGTYSGSATETVFQSNKAGDKAFDGFTSTEAVVDESSPPSWIYFRPTSAFTGISTLRIATSYVQSFKFNGGTVNSTPAPANSGVQWYTFDPSDIPSSLAEIAVEGSHLTSGSNARITAIEIDGVILVDGVTQTATALNNPNDGTKWSDYVSGTAYSSDGLAEFAFNGLHWSQTYNDQHRAVPEGDSWFTWTPPTPISMKRLRVWFGYKATNADFKINGVQNNTNLPSASPHSGTMGWIEYSGYTSISSIAWYDGAGGAEKSSVGAIEIDGCILLDSSVDNSFHLKFNNVSNNTALGKDTLKKISDCNGGLPIYNTSDDYGDVKDTGYAEDSNAAALKLAIPGDVLTDEHDHVTNATGSAVTVTANGSIAVSTDQSRFYGSSIRFDGSDDNLTISSPPFTISDRSTTYTIEGWIWADDSVFSDNTYRSIFNAGDLNIGFWRSSHANGKKIYVEGDGSGGTWGATLYSSVISSETWYHIAFVRNGTSLKLFLNGVLQQEVTSSGTDSAESAWIMGAAVSARWKGYQSDFKVYDTAIYSANFKPRTTNDWTVTNLTTTGAGTDSLTDTPTNYLPTNGNDALGGVTRGNYCTLNPLSVTSGWTFSQGNLEVVSTSSYGTVKGTIGMTSGKWYAEMTAQSDNTAGAVGVVRYDHTNTYVGGSASDIGYGYLSDGRKATTSDTRSTYGATWATGDTIGIALDLSGSTGTVTFYKNGATQGQAFTLTTADGPWFFASFDDSNGSHTTQTWNFGQSAFASTAPTDHLALCTQNLDDTFSGASVNNPSKYFDVKTWTGTGASLDIKNMAFNPDLVWIKSRDATYDHAAFDAIRGVNKRLRVNQTNAQGTDTQTLTHFLSDGFTTGTDDVTNKSGDKYVSWNWDAGTAAVGSPGSSGDMTAATQWVNTAAGFSISTVVKPDGTTNQTFEHGLGATPSVVLQRRYDETEDWYWYTRDVDGSHDFLKLNESDGKGDTGTTVPTDTLATTMNAAGNYLVYCWAPKIGYSAFGAYDGSGSETFIYTGFQPRWIMVKLTSETLTHGGWKIIDTTRNPYNDGEVRLKLSADLSEVENGNTSIANNEGDVDILSNGFRITDNHAPWNTSGRSYIYACFAEFPFKTARAR